MSYFSSVSFRDSANIDAFSRLRTSDPLTLFQVQNQYNASPVIMEGGATGTGVAPAHNSDTRMVKLSATSGTGVSYYQSYEYIPYQPGKSQLVFITGVLDTAVANAVKDVGYFDAANGIFLRQNGTSGLQVVRRTSTSGSVSNNAVNQSSWNIDKMDGTGVSGINLDVTTAFILVIDLQFLGMGRVRIGFDVNGVIYYAHQFLNANSLSVPYMQMATLPVQALLTATSTGSTANLYFKCASVISEGGFEEQEGLAFSTPEGTATAADGARTHILSLRPATTFNSITNRIHIALTDIVILVTGNNPVYWELVVGAAFTGGAEPTWASVNATYSGSQYGTGGTFNNLTSGIVIESGYVPSGNQTKGAVTRLLAHRYPISLDRAGAVRSLGTVSLLVSGIGAASATRAAFSFEEVR